MSLSAGNAASGALAGAGAGAVLGPWGAAGGAIIGGLSGLLSGSDAPQVYDPNRGTFYNGAPNAAADRGLATSALNNAINRRAPQMTAAGLGPATIYGNSTINTAPQNQSRNYQFGLMDQLSRTASGNGPSISDAVLKTGLNQTLAQEKAAAASQRGFGNTSATGYNLGTAAAGANANTVGQAAAAKIQEAQNAQALLGNLSTGARGQDIGLATGQAQLEAQQNQFNANALNSFQVQAATMGQDAAAKNLAAQLQTMGMSDQEIQAMIQSIVAQDRAQKEDEMRYETLKTQASTGTFGQQSKNSQLATDTLLGGLSGFGQGLSYAGKSNPGAWGLSSSGSDAAYDAGFNAGGGGMTGKSVTGMRGYY